MASTTLTFQRRPGEADEDFADRAGTAIEQLPDMRDMTRVEVREEALDDGFQVTITCFSPKPLDSKNTDV